MSRATLRLSRVHLWVRNLADSAAFYLQMFGLEPVVAGPSNDGICVCRRRNDADDRGGELILTEGLPLWADLIGLEHFSFEVRTAAEVDAIYCKARDRGHRATQPRMYAGSWQTFVFDPDGYKIEVFTHERSARRAIPDDAQSRHGTLAWTDEPSTDRKGIACD